MLAPAVNIPLGSCDTKQLPLIVFDKYSVGGASHKEQALIRSNKDVLKSKLFFRNCQTDPMLTISRNGTSWKLQTHLLSSVAVKLLLFTATVAVRLLALSATEELGKGSWAGVQ